MKYYGRISIVGDCTMDVMLKFAFGIHYFRTILIIMSFKNKSVKHETIFHSSGYPRIDVYTGEEEFYLLLEQGLFSVSITSIHHSPTVAQLLNLVQDHRYETLESLYKWHPILWKCYCQVGGGIQHKFLACCGTAWLLDQSYEVEFETWRDNKCVDIATKTVDWIIECGDTSPAPVFDHLRCSCRYFAVLPFQDFYKENCLEMFVFGYGQNWHQSNVEKALDERLEQQKTISNQLEAAFSALRSGSVPRREVIVQDKKYEIAISNNEKGVWCAYGFYDRHYIKAHSIKNSESAVKNWIRKADKQSRS